MNFVRDHECRIEAQTEVSDDLGRVLLILVLLEELLRSGERDLRNILDHFVLGHADAVVDKLQGLLIRVDDDMHFIFVPVFRTVLADAFELFQFRDRVAGIRDLLSYENIVIGIQPLLDNRQHILTVNG